jgi:hypothetical protein
MTDTTKIKEQPCFMTDLEWFDSICYILKKENNPTTHRLTDIIGTEEPNPKNQIRGSKFLDAYDKRFIGACINPNIATEDKDQPLDYLGFWGNSFKIKIGDIAERFAYYRTIRNTYDGGTQIFFYPVPAEFEFTAIDCWTEKEGNEIVNLTDLVVKGVTFRFGDKLIQGRDGYGMRRK